MTHFKETDIVVEPSESEAGMWYWAFKIGGEVYADGDAESNEEALWKAREARWEWEDRNR